MTKPLLKEKRVVYLDFDGTICFKPEVIEKTKIHPFENTYDDIDNRNAIRKIFNDSFIKQDTLNKMKKLKNSGVSIVGITYREELSAFDIHPDVLQYISKIYYCSEAKRANIINGKAVKDLAYDNLWMTLKGTELANRRSDIEQIINKHFPSIQPLNLHVPDSPIDYFDARGLSKDQIKHLTHILSPYCASTCYYDSCGAFEVAHVYLSKLEAIRYDMAEAKKDGYFIYGVCAGDSLMDYEMLHLCQVGIFPQALMKKIVDAKCFPAIGSKIAKVVIIEDDTWQFSLLDEIHSAFLKHTRQVDK